MRVPQLHQLAGEGGLSDAPKAHDEHANVRGIPERNLLEFLDHFAPLFPGSETERDFAGVLNSFSSVDWKF
jgi:hypothetical protein